MPGGEVTSYDLMPPPSDYPGYVRRPGNPNAAWGEQGMMGPRPAVPAPPIPYNPGTGMNPYDLGPPIDTPPGPPLEWTPAPTAPAPDVGRGIEGMGRPAPPADIGPGIPVSPEQLNPGSQVTSFDLPPAPVTAPNAAPGGMRFNPRDVFSALTSPGPPPSRRYSSTRPEFIFTNPAAAAQAARNYEARLGYESAQDQGFRQYQGELAAQREATQRAEAATEAARANEATRLAAIQAEGKAQRASNERISYMNDVQRQFAAAEKAWMDNERNASLAESMARTKNNNPDEKVDPRYIELGPDKKTWVASGAFKRYKRPTLQDFLPPGWTAPTGAATPEPGQPPIPGPAVPQAEPTGPPPAQPVPEGAAPPTAAVPTGEPPPYNMAESFPNPSGVLGWTGPGLVARGVRAVWPYSPTGWVMNRIVGAFRGAPTPPPAPAVPAQ